MESLQLDLTMKDVDDVGRWSNLPHSGWFYLLLKPQHVAVYSVPL